MKSVVCVLLLMSAALFAQEKNPVTAAARDISSSRGKNLVAAAEEMPADKYDYRPTAAQMTFGHIVMHTAKSNYFLCSKISGTEAPKSDIKDTDAKDKLVTALKDSASYCDLAKRAPLRQRRPCLQEPPGRAARENSREAVRGKLLPRSGAGSFFP